MPDENQILAWKQSIFAYFNKLHHFIIVVFNSSLKDMVNSCFPRSQKQVVMMFSVQEEWGEPELWLKPMSTLEEGREVRDLPPHPNGTTG